MISNIDISVLTKALIFFMNKGYYSLSAPMLVDKDIIDFTIPPNAEAKIHKNSYKYYVGSAEQSFLQLVKENKLPKVESKFMMITPCQRDEEVYDQTHFEIFLKLELITLDTDFNLILQDVISFYKTININPVIVNMDNNTKDLELNNLEIGSYGSRVFSNTSQLEDFIYSYGTGIALPRFTQALNNRI